MTDTAADTIDTARKAKPLELKYPLSYVLIDHPGSGAPDSATLTQWAAAITKGMMGDFANEYQIGATVRFDTSPAPGEIVCGFFEHPDQPGAYGYHDWPPIVKLFPKLNAKDGSPLSPTLDHEVKEATLDLTIDQARSGHDGHFWADEPCDAVEQDTYTIDGVPLSNFVTGSWYSARSGKYDFLGKLKSPLSLTAGGYAQYFDPKKGWQQIVHQELAPRAYRTRDGSRFHARRARSKFNKETGLWTL